MKEITAAEAYERVMRKMKEQEDTDFNLEKSAFYAWLDGKLERRDVEVLENGMLRVLYAGGFSPKCTQHLMNQGFILIPTTDRNGWISTHVMWTGPKQNN